GRRRGGLQMVARPVIDGSDGFSQRSRDSRQRRTGEAFSRRQAEQGEERGADLVHPAFRAVRGGFDSRSPEQIHPFFAMPQAGGRGGGAGEMSRPSFFPAETV